MHGTFPEACALVIGFDRGAGGDLFGEFQRWLGPRHGGRSELVFWHHVLDEAFPGEGVTPATELTEEQHRIAVDKLFELLDLFLSERPAGE